MNKDSRITSEDKLNQETTESKVKKGAGRGLDEPVMFVDYPVETYQDVIDFIKGIGSFDGLGMVHEVVWNRFGELIEELKANPDKFNDKPDGTLPM